MTKRIITAGRISGNNNNNGNSKEQLKNKGEKLQTKTKRQ